MSGSFVNSQTFKIDVNIMIQCDYIYNYCLYEFLGLPDDDIPLCSSGQLVTIHGGPGTGSSSSRTPARSAHKRLPTRSAHCSHITESQSLEKTQSLLPYAQTSPETSADSPKCLTVMERRSLMYVWERFLSASQHHCCIPCWFKQYAEEEHTW